MVTAVLTLLLSCLNQSKGKDGLSAELPLQALSPAVPEAPQRARFLEKKLGEQVFILVLPLVCCVSLEKLLALSVLQFSHL